MKNLSSSKIVTDKKSFQIAVFRQVFLSLLFRDFFRKFQIEIKKLVK